MNCILYLVILLICMIFFLRFKENFNMPQSRDNDVQREIKTNISNFKKLNVDSLSLLTNLSPGTFTIKKKICVPNQVVTIGAPKEICKNFKGVTVGFDPEEIKKYKMPELIRDGAVSNDIFVPLLVDAFKKVYKNIKDQEKKIAEIIKKIDSM